MNTWQFSPDQGDKAVSVVGSNDVVFYIDDLNPEVVSKIVEIYNDGNDPIKVDEYLEGEERCTEDEREFIMEQIGTFIKLTSEEGKQAVAEVGATLDVKPIKDQKDPPFEADPLAKKTGTGTVEPEPDKKKRTRRVLQPDASGQVTGKKAPSNPEDVIKQLKEKIQLIEILGASEVPEIPTGLTKPSREIMLEFQERQESLIAEFMERIQKM